MSDIPDDWRGQLDLRAEIVRIDRERAEAQKFNAEREKLLEEATKFRREPWGIMLAAFSALLGALIGTAPVLITFLLKGIP